MKTKVKFYIATYLPMEDDEQPTKEVLAVFTDEVQAVVNGEKHLLCYAHLGQHCECSVAFIKESCKEATEDEYKELFNELTNKVGYKLQVL